MSVTQPASPVYVISKGRWKPTEALTARFLERDGVDFRLVVEPQEADRYAAEGWAHRLLVAPEDFSKRGQGSIPVRNFVWDHSIDAGAERHWILDDNIRDVRRLVRGQRVPCNSALGFRAVETFSDRYENVGIAGLNYQMFVTALTSKPFALNVHVYSCMLILNRLPYRWRGRYNEDTDLCLQVLSSGEWCTVLFNVFMADKLPTGQMKGGNAEELYVGDGRLKMARALERRWPYVSKTERRYGRPQHVIRGNWRGFDTPLRRRTDIDWDALPPVDEMGSVAVAKAPIQSPVIRSIYDAHKRPEATEGSSATPGPRTRSRRSTGRRATSPTKQKGKR